MPVKMIAYTSLKVKTIKYISLGTVINTTLKQQYTIYFLKTQNF